MVVSVLLLLSKLTVEATPIGIWVGNETRALLLNMLPPFRERGPDAIVVDISHLAGDTRNPQGGKAIPTPRAELLALLETLKRLRPAAIGIDIDLAETAEGWMDVADPAFFERCLELNKQVPIRLGVERTLGAKDRRWLNDPRFAPLAAALYFTELGSGRLPVWVAVNESSTEPPQASEGLLTLGASLAVALVPSRRGPLAPSLREEWTLAGFVFEPVTSKLVRHEPSDVVAWTREALVNYSVVRQLSREFIPKATPFDLVKYESRIRGRVVLIGDVEDADDFHAIPGDRINRPGVMLHAAQAHTFTTEPVYEFGHTFRVVLDLALPALVMLTVVLARRFAPGADLRSSSHVERRAILILGVSVVGLAAMLAYNRIFWPDFILVVIFLALHRPTEARLVHAIQRAWGVS